MAAGQNRYSKVLLTARQCIGSWCGAVAGAERCCDQIVRVGGVDVVIKALSEGSDDVKVVESACRTLAHVVNARESPGHICHAVARVRVVAHPFFPGLSLVLPARHRDATRQQAMDTGMRVLSRCDTLEACKVAPEAYSLLIAAMGTGNYRALQVSAVCVFAQPLTTSILCIRGSPRRRLR